MDLQLANGYSSDGAGLDFFFFNLEDSDKILQNATVNIDFLITVLIHVFCA